MEPFLFLLVALGAAGIAWFQWHRGNRRREELAALALGRGLSFGRHDRGRVEALPFKHLRKGDRRGVDHVMSGELGGRQLLVFDHWYEEITRDHEGRRQRQKFTFTCAVAPLDDAFVPNLTIEPESLFSRAKDAIGFRDLEFESDDFNRRFEVRARDNRFAYAFVDARMIQWLLGTPGEFAYEVFGQHVMIISPRQDAQGWLTLHHMVTDMAGRAPSVVREWYPLEESR